MAPRLFAHNDVTTMNNQNAHLAVMNAALGINCYLSDFASVLAKVADLDSESQFRHLRLCEKAFAVAKFRNHEATRVGAAKILVALLPKSVLVLKRLLQKNHPKLIHEIHFSLFCYLDEVQHFDRLKSARKPVLNLLVAYLMKSKGDHAHACWMAADLLGDHWALRDSLSPLLIAAQNAKNPPARVAAISGLSKALRRCSAKDRIRIGCILEWLSKNDPSQAVRFEAETCLKGSGRE
jgi:hypothetical protein